MFDILWLLSQKYGDSDIYLNAQKGIGVEYQKGNLVGLRLASKDLDYWLKEMPPEDYLELAGILKSEIQEDVFKNEKNRVLLIKKVLKRGKINSIEEYELLSNRTDEIYDKNKYEKELLKINQLLKDFNS